jgi:hypothetical protein
MLKIFKPITAWFGKQMTYTKILLAFLTYKCVGWIDQSYALAWADKPEIAESLSREVMIAGVGVLIGYMAKSVFESMSENNAWPDKPANTGEQRDC